MICELFIPFNNSMCPCSLWQNNIADDGGMALAEAMKHNATLTKLE